MSAWTEEEDEIISKGFAEGLSAAQLVYRPGINDRTRNAIIGRLSRLGIRRDSKEATSLLLRNQLTDRFTVDREIIRLAKAYKSATVYEISEACATEFATVQRIMEAHIGYRPLGGEKDFQSAAVRERVASMRAQLMERA